MRKVLRDDMREVLRNFQGKLNRCILDWLIFGNKEGRYEDSFEGSYVGSFEELRHPRLRYHSKQRGQLWGKLGVKLWRELWGKIKREVIRKNMIMRRFDVDFSRLFLFSSIFSVYILINLRSPWKEGKIGWWQYSDSQIRGCISKRTNWSFSFLYQRVADPDWETLVHGIYVRW